MFKGTGYSFEQVLSICGGLWALYYFSGPRRESDFSQACSELGACAKPLDVEIGVNNMDLLDEAVTGEYIAAMCAK